MRIPTIAGDDYIFSNKSDILSVSIRRPDRYLLCHCKNYTRDFPNPSAYDVTSSFDWWNTAATATYVSLTLMSIRSGRNVIIMCAVTIIVTIPMITYGAALSIYDVIGLWPSIGFIAVWIAGCNTFVNRLLYLFLFRSVRTKAATMFSELFDMCHIRCTPTS